MRTVAFKFPVELWEQIEALAGKRKSTPSSLVRTILAAYLLGELAVQKTVSK